MKRIYILILSVLVFASVSRADEIFVQGYDIRRPLDVLMLGVPYREIENYWGYFDTDTGKVTPEYTMTYRSAFDILSGTQDILSGTKYVNLIKGKAYEFAWINEGSPYYPNFGAIGTAYRTYDISNTPDPLEGWEFAEGIDVSVYTPTFINSNKIDTDIIANKLADGIEDSNAMSAALSALPNTAPDAESYCGGGLGSYGESQAFSLGCASNINDNLTVNFGASKLASGGASVGNRQFDDYSLKAGFIYKIGYKPSKSSKSNTARLETELYRQQASLRAIAEKENYKDTKIAEYESRLAKLEEQRAIETAEYKHKFTKLEEQLEELKVAMLAGNKEFASLAE